VARQGGEAALDDAAADEGVLRLLGVRLLLC
jgi:hypothetical protein